MTQTISIVLDGQDLASSEINQVSDNLGNLGGQAQGTGQSMQGMSSNAQTSGNQFMDMSGKAGLAVKALGGFAAAGIALNKFKDTVVELNAELGPFQLEIQRLETLVGNMSSTAVEADERLEHMGDQIEEMGQRSGEPISNLNELMTELTLRFGDADVASDNFERAMDLMAFTGMDAASAARALSDAQAGHFSRLRREGALTREQAQKLSEMADEGEAAAQAMGIIDENIGGFVDQVPDAVDASDRLEQSWERLRIAAAELLGVDRIMSGMASTMETLADSAEEWADAWVRGASSITEEMEKLDTQVSNVNDQLTDFGDDAHLRDYERQVRQVRWEYDQQISALVQIRDMEANTLDELNRQSRAKRRITELEQEREESLQTLEDSFIRQEASLQGQTEWRQQQLGLEQQALDAASEEERIRLETQHELNEIVRERDRQLNELIDENGQITDEQKEQVIEQEAMVKITKLQQQADEEIANLKTDQVGVQEGLNDMQLLSLELKIQAIELEQMGQHELSILMHQESDLIEIRQRGLEPLEEQLEILRLHVRTQEELDRLVEEDIKRQNEKTDALIRQNEEALEESKRLIEEISEPVEIGLTADQVIGEDMERGLQRQIAQLEAYELALRGVSDTFRDMSVMVRQLGQDEHQQNRQNIDQLREKRRLQREVGEDTEHIDQQIDALRRENEELRENNRLQQQRLDALSRTTEQLAQMSFALADVADQQWDFEEASQSVVAAQQALSGAVSAALSAAGLGIQEKAKWMAAFEAAQAAAALGLALTFPSPNYWAAFANHTIAATQFGLIGSGVIGSGGGGPTTGGSGGGGGASSVNRDSIIDEAMRRQEDIASGERDQGAINISIDMRRSTNLRTATDTAEEIYTSIQPFLEDDI